MSKGVEQDKQMRCSPHAIFQESKASVDLQLTLPTILVKH